MSGLQPAVEQGSRRRIHHVTPQMIEIVQQVAPSLTEEQISYDLEQTGDVNRTVDRFLNHGTLPFPPGCGPTESSPANSTSDETVSNAKNASNSVDATEPSEGPFGRLNFETKRVELVKENRKALEREYGIPWSKIVLQK